jgi:hypothetical protein
MIVYEKEANILLDLIIMTLVLSVLIVIPILIVGFQDHGDYLP